MTDATARPDALREFVDLAARETGNAKPFEGGEHLWIGSHGARRAHERARLDPHAFDHVRRSEGDVALSYGTVVALSGDFYERPEDLWRETPTAFQGNDLADIQSALGDEIAWIATPAEERRTRYPDKNFAYWWNAKHYAELARRNTSHFGWHNALEYAAAHRRALGFALAAREATHPTAEDRLWREAIYTNAFADHFLTDGFAAGHVRTPAREIRAWAEGNGWSDRLAGALIKVVHDQDGHVHTIHGSATHAGAEGLRVVNARGDDFRTRCDGQLFVTGTSDPAIEAAIEAVAASVGELLAVRSGAPIPTGAFAATAHLPWPHPEEPALIAKFPSDVSNERLVDLYDGIQRYIRVVARMSTSHIRDCFQALPRFMEQFRATVASDAGTSPDVVRLHADYVEAYRSIR